VKHLVSHAATDAGDLVTEKLASESAETGAVEAVKWACPASAAGHANPKSQPLQSAGDGGLDLLGPISPKKRKMGRPKGSATKRHKVDGSNAHVWCVISTLVGTVSNVSETTRVGTDSEQCAVSTQTWTSTTFD
jgi:hypothetical protein